jgi:hypothetical protein
MRILRLVAVLIFGFAQFAFAIPAFGKSSNYALKGIALAEEHKQVVGARGGSSCPIDLDRDGHCDYVYRTQAFGKFQYAKIGSIIWASEWKHCTSKNTKNGQCVITFDEINGKQISFRTDGAEFSGEYGIIPDILTIIGAVSGPYTKTFTLDAKFSVYVNTGYGARYTANKIIHYYSGRYKNYYRDSNTPSTGSKLGSAWWYKKPGGVINDSNIQRTHP